MKNGSWKKDLVRSLIGGWEQLLKSQLPSYGRKVRINGQPIFFCSENDRWGAIAQKVTVKIQPEGIFIEGVEPRTPLDVVIVEEELTIREMAYPVPVTPENLSNLDKMAWLQNSIAQSFRKSVPRVIDHKPSGSKLTVNRRFSWSKLWTVEMHTKGAEVKEVATIQKEGTIHPYVVLIIGGGSR